jgi:hypothetical protein
VPFDPVEPVIAILYLASTILLLRAAGVRNRRDSGDLRRR